MKFPVVGDEDESFSQDVPELLRDSYDFNMNSGRVYLRAALRIKL